MKFKLRKHQKKQNKLTYKVLKKQDHILYAAPTGFGKSLCILDMVQKFIDNGERVLVIAPYRKLIFQLMGTFENEAPALLMGSDSYGNVREASLVVASLSTLSRRLSTDANYIGNIDKIIIDEVHIGFNIPNKTPSKVVIPVYNRYWHGSKWIGFTATPITAGGYRLEGWDHTIFKYNTKWLIDKGWLSGFDYLSSKAIDTSGLKLQITGDYKVDDMEKVTNNAAAISAVIKNYNKHCADKKTLLFAVSINHAELIHDEFKLQGISVAIIHSQLPEKEQRHILEGYKNNAYAVLINVAMLTTGFDDPEVEALIIARPIGSLRLAIQVWGRVLRIHDDIDKVLILDLTGTCDEVGHYPDDNFNFDKVKGERDPVEREESDSIENVLWDCSECGEVSRMIDCKRDSQLTDEMSITTYFCPACGGVIREKEIDLSANEISKVKTASDVDMTQKYSHKEVMQGLGELISANTQNAKTSWGAYIHKTCLRKDKKRYMESFYGYVQGIYNSSKSWRRIMDIYGS